MTFQFIIDQIIRIQCRVSNSIINCIKRRPEVENKLVLKEFILDFLMTFVQGCLKLQVKFLAVSEEAYRTFLGTFVDYLEFKWNSFNNRDKNQIKL